MLTGTRFGVASFVAAVMAAGVVGGCSVGGDGGYGHDHYSSNRYGYDHHDYRSGDYHSGDYAAYRQDVNKERGDRNTVISDKVDDGRVNGSARSYEERKAGRAADEGVPGAAREERELRHERLEGR